MMAVIMDDGRWMQVDDDVRSLIVAADDDDDGGSFATIILIRVQIYCLFLVCFVFVISRS